MRQERRLATGEFARRTGLSLKALRIYDENGLLRPAEVDPATGRRGYGAEQVPTARLIGTSLIIRSKAGPRRRGRKERNRRRMGEKQLFV